MEIIKTDELQFTDYGLYQIFDTFNKSLGKKIKMGRAVIKPGARVPLEGMNSHAEDEFSYLLKGSLVKGTENVLTRISYGDFGIIPKETK